MNDRTLTDTQITAAFIARSEGSVGQDLAERIRAETSRTRQASRLLVLTGGLSDNANAHRLLWAAAISATSLALVGGLFFAGRQPDEQTSVVPPPSPSQPVAGPPTPSADPSMSLLPSPSAEPTPAVTNPPVDPTLDLELFAVTLVDQLRVRSQPTVAESSEKLEPLLPAGVRLFVIEESVAADGYAWYHVLPVEGGYPSGWLAAASRGGEPWIEAAPAECPSLPIEPLEIEFVWRVRRPGLFRRQRDPAHGRGLLPDSRRRPDDRRAIVAPRRSVLHVLGWGWHQADLRRRRGPPGSGRAERDRHRSLRRSPVQQLRLGRRPAGPRRGRDHDNVPGDVRGHGLEVGADRLNRYLENGATIPVAPFAVFDTLSDGK